MVGPPGHGDVKKASAVCRRNAASVLGHDCEGDMAHARENMAQHALPRFFLDRPIYYVASTVPSIMPHTVVACDVFREVGYTFPRLSMQLGDGG